MKTKFSRIISFLIVFTIICSSSVPINVFASTNQDEVFTDIKGHWAEDVIMRHYQKGMLKGYPDGTFKPNKGMKRCELIALINRYFGLKKGADDNYSDVNSKSWYFKDTAKAKYYNYVDGLNVEPEKNATRQDVVGMLALLLDLEEQSKNNDKINFSDIDVVDKKSQINIENFSEMGYLKGYPDGTFKPDKVINRAEIMNIAESVLGYIIKNEDDLNNIPKDVSKITIINPDLTIENLDTDAHIYISAGVTGNLILKDCKLGGKVEVTGGNKDCSIVFDNVNINKFVVTHTNEEPVVKIKNSNVVDINVKTKTHIIIDGYTVVDKVNVNSNAQISGKGKVKEAYINSDGVTIENKPDYVKVTKKDIDVKVGNRKINHKNDNDRPITDNRIEIEKVDINGQFFQSKELIAQVSPSGATVTYQWQRETTDNNFEDILDATVSKYILTKEDVDKRVRVVVKGINEYKGRVISGPTSEIKDMVSLEIENGWIPIANKDELNNINNDVKQVFGAGTKYEDSYVGGLDKKYMLISNIDLSGENFVPIGYSNEKIKEFTGKFNGKIYSINNLNIERDEQYQGLFSKLGSDSEIINVHIKDVNIKTSSYSGVLAGQANESSIKDSKIENVTLKLFAGKKTKGYDDYVTNKRIGLGGFVGKSIDSKFSNLQISNFSLVAIDTYRNNSNAESVGALVGYLNGGKIENCNASDIVLKAKHNGRKGEKFYFHGAAGLIGTVYNTNVKTLEISNCKVENLDMLIGGGLGLIADNCGGLIGEISPINNTVNTNGDIYIDNCNVTGVIQGIERDNYVGMFGTYCAGGFIGKVGVENRGASEIEINNCGASVNMFDFVYNERSIDVLLQTGGIGGFFGVVKNVTIKNCYADGDIGKFGDYEIKTRQGKKRDEKSTLAGFGGYSYGSKLLDSYSKGNVCAGCMYTSGFLAVVSETDIERCYSMGDVDTKNMSIIGGAFTGLINRGVKIKDCYALGNINGAGFNSSFIAGTFKDLYVKNCFCAGETAARRNSTAFAAGSYGEYYNCHYNKDVNKDLPGNNGQIKTQIMGQTESELKSIDTFKGWDISEKGSGQNTVWLIEEGVTYPYLNKDYVHVVSTNCDIVQFKCPKVNSSTSTAITTTVENDVSTLTVDVRVSDYATWNLYSDLDCTTVIDKKVNLNIGENVYYIKVLAEDGVSSKTYTLSIVRKDVVKVETINVSGDNNVGEITQNGGSLQMVAEILPVNAKNKDVQWSVNDESIATISNTGLLTAIKDGTVIVKAKSKDGTNIVGSCSIDITGQKQNELKAVRVKRSWNQEEQKDEYVIAENQSDITNPIGIWKVEDLLIINSSEEYLSDSYVLLEDIDFNDINCYRFPNDRHFDTDKDGIKETVFEELKQDGNTGTGFVPIGSKDNTFKGEFNGNKHIISNLYINRNAEDNIGFFGYIDKDGYENMHMLGKILSLELKNSSIVGNKNVGVLAGSIEGSKIDRCSSTGTTVNITSLNGVVGGLIGSSTSSAAISSCYNEQNVSTNSDIAGGLIGLCSNTRVTDCYAIGNVSGNDMVGGLVGKVESVNGKKSTILKTYTMGTVVGRSQIGGIIGYNDNGEIKRNIAFNDSITGDSKEVGRVIGKNNKGKLEFNYANNLMNLSTDSGSTLNLILDGLCNNINGLNMLKEQFSNQETYEGNLKLYWSFRHCWKMDNDLKRPILRKEINFS